LVLRVLRVYKVFKAIQDRLALLAQMVLQAQLVRKDLKVCKVPREIPVLKVRQGPTVPQVLKVLSVLSVLKVLKVLKVLQAQRERLAHRDLKETPGLKDLQAQQVQQVQMAQPDLSGQMGLKVSKVSKVTLGLMALKDRLVLKDHRETLDLRDHRAFRVFQEHPVSLAPFQPTRTRQLFQKTWEQPVSGVHSKMSRDSLRVSRPTPTFLSTPLLH
jgi:hypothetical protein